MGLDASKKGNRNLKVFLFDYLPIIIIFPAVITIAIVKQQMWIKALPLCVSLVVFLLIANINRFGFLVGAANSVIYSIGFFFEKLYGSMATALLVNFPIQILSFILWSRKRRQSEKQSVKLRRLDKKGTMLLLLFSAVLMTAAYFILRTFNNEQPVFDTVTLAFGLIIAVMQMLAIVEAYYLCIPYGISALVMWAIIAANNPANLTYLIFQTYVIYRYIQGCVNATIKYTAQKKAISREDSLEKA